jgi:hypothetical protein
MPPTVADMRTRPLLAGAAAVLTLAAVGCGSAASSQAPSPNATETSPAGDIPDNQAYVAYRPPGGGYSVKVPEGWARTAKGGAVTFTDKLNAIRMESVPASGPLPPRPPGALARDGRTIALSIERHVFRHGGRRVVLTLSGPKGADNVDPWRIVTSSLRWTR